jgi:ribosome-binding protein aMBF1 (putative translation factor)
MNIIQTKLFELKTRGWTYAAIANELDLTSDAINKWKAGDRYPANEKAVIAMLEQLEKRKRVPRQRRYKKGNRKFTSNKEHDNG